MPEIKRGSSYYELFPEGLVYPGHPACIALLIMRHYPDLESAVAKPTADASYGSALSDSCIPGAGSNVHAAIELLRRAREQGPEAGFVYGEQYWRECASGSNFSKNYDGGQAQALSIKEVYLELAGQWVMPANKGDGPLAPSM